jgi:hypothetical protein
VQEVAAEQIGDVEYEDEAYASSITAEANELLPPPPAFTIPPMDCLLGGPSARWLVDDPESDFSDDELTTPAPPIYYYPRHGYGPCLPSPMPSGEEQEHFAPPGYAPMTEFFQPPVAVPMDALPSGLDLNIPAPEMNIEEVGDAIPARTLPVLSDLNHQALEVKSEENEDAPHTPSLSTPSLEALVLLRRLASSMAARPTGIRRGTWCPEALGLTCRVAELRLNEPAHYSSSSAEGSSRR